MCKARGGHMPLLFSESSYHNKLQEREGQQFRLITYYLILYYPNNRSYFFLVISTEIRPLAALYPTHKKVWFIGLRSRASLSISALSGRRGWCAFAPIYIVSVKKIYMGGGITLPGVWFQGTLPFFPFFFFVVLQRRYLVFSMLYFIYNAIANTIT